MASALTPPRAALGGTAVIMACACGTAASTAKLLLLAGVAATTTMVHPVFIGLAAVLIVYGLWRTAPRSGMLAAGAFAVLGIAAALTPPRVMSAKAVPWNSMQMLGGALYLAAAAVLAYAFWRAFPSRRPAASATAMSGMALSTGCSCCMFTGAMAGMAVTTGAISVFQSTGLIFWSGMAVVAVGLYRLGGLRAATWVPVGGAIIRFAPELLKLTGDWMAGGVNFRFIPDYLTTVFGAAVVLYGFVVAYRESAAAVLAAPAEAGRPEAEPRLATA